MLRGSVFLTLLAAKGALAGVTSSYIRGPESSPQLEIAHEHPAVTASQVFVAPAAGDGGVTVGWVTNGPSGASQPSARWRCTGDDSCGDWQETAAETTSYTSALYQSGSIHHANLVAPRGSHVSFTLGGSEVFEVDVPPGPEVLQDRPFVIAVVGDIGQTANSISTVQHVLEDAPDLVVVPGDLSYADCDQNRWDSWGKLAQPLTSSVPLLTVPGNHEHEGGCGPAFQAYTKRFRMPVEANAAEGAMYYSFESAGVHFLMLSSYSPIHPGSPQLAWLVSDLASVDRQRTPWLVAALHAPWYNSNSHHQNEGEPAAFQREVEPLLYAAGTDVVFAGHVHAYERSEPAFNGRPDPCGVTYITIGDGGNREGLAFGWAEPQPEWSAFRESSYGHGRLAILNATHATWAWHRNNDGEKVAAEDIVLVADTQGCPNSRLKADGAREHDAAFAATADHVLGAEGNKAAAAAAGGGVPKVKPLRLSRTGAAGGEETGKEAGGVPVAGGGAEEKLLERVRAHSKAAASQ